MVKTMTLVDMDLLDLSEQLMLENHLVELLQQKLELLS